jgi:DNA-binding MarR family transcriptional regulator
MSKPRHAESKLSSKLSVTPTVGLVISPLADSPAFLVRLAQLRAFDEFFRNFAGLNVTPAGLAVFALIAANPGVRPGTISEELRMKPSNVAALVNSLVAAGLVQRKADASERRASLLHVTKFGARAWHEMERTHREMDLRFTADLSAAERKQFVALLRKLLHR